MDGADGWMEAVGWIHTGRMESRRQADGWMGQDGTDGTGRILSLGGGKKKDKKKRKMI